MQDSFLGLCALRVPSVNQTRPKTQTQIKILKKTKKVSAEMVVYHHQLACHGQYYCHCAIAAYIILFLYKYRPLSIVHGKGPPYGRVIAPSSLILHCRSICSFSSWSSWCTCLAFLVNDWSFFLNPLSFLIKISLGTLLSLSFKILLL